MTTYRKYPHTPYLAWSPSVDINDEVLDTTSHFEGKEIVVTEKLDGENTTMYHDHIHARSIDSANHPSRNWVRALHGQIAHDIPEGMRICGENLYAKHAIHYSNLSTYFFVFSIWDAENCALSWDDTVEWTKLLGLQHVPVLYRGVWDEDIVKGLYHPTIDGNEMEGYVVRLAASFSYKDFERSLAKWVRKGHVQAGDDHWSHKQVIPNGLKDKV